MRTIHSIAIAAAVLSLAACSGDSATGLRAPDAPDVPNLRRQNDDGCSAVSGEIDEAGSIWPAAAKGTITGSFEGTTSGTGVLTSSVHNLAVWTGSHTFSTLSGDLYAADVFELKTGPKWGDAIGGTLTITGGTGMYEGATGTLSVSGRHEAYGYLAYSYAGTFCPSPV